MFTHPPTVPTRRVESEMLNIQGFEELFYGEGFIELFTLPGSRATEDVASSGLLLTFERILRVATLRRYTVYRFQGFRPRSSKVDIPGVSLIIHNPPLRCA